MADEQRFAELLCELERVGVDPNTLSAGLAVNHDDAMRVLRDLADHAGPEAFLAKLRSHVPPRARSA